MIYNIILWSTWIDPNSKALPTLVSGGWPEELFIQTTSSFQPELQKININKVSQRYSHKQKASKTNRKW